MRLLTFPACVGSWGELSRGGIRRAGSCAETPRGCPGCDEMEPYGHTRTGTRKRTHARTQPCSPNGSAVPVACLVPHTAPAASLVPGAVHAAPRASAGNVEGAPRLPLPSPASYSGQPSGRDLPLHHTCPTPCFWHWLSARVLCSYLACAHSCFAAALSPATPTWCPVSPCLLLPWCLSPACPLLSHCPHALPQQCCLPSQVPSIPGSLK